MAPSTASPPPPTLPTSSTPGERARKLRDVYSRALKNALKPVSDYGNFAACFPTPAKYCENALRELHSDFVRKLGATCESEFDALLQEREVVKSLNELDALVEEAKRRREKSAQGESADSTAPHLSKPEQLLQLHLQPFTSEQTAGLQSRLESAQAGNRQLAEEIEAQQSEINALLSGLEYAIADLDNANRAFQAHGTDDLMTAMND